MIHDHAGSGIAWQHLCKNNVDGKRSLKNLTSKDGRNLLVIRVKSFPDNPVYIENVKLNGSKTWYDIRKRKKF